MLLRNGLLVFEVSSSVLHAFEERSAMEALFMEALVPVMWAVEKWSAISYRLLSQLGTVC